MNVTTADGRVVDTQSCRVGRTGCTGTTIKGQSWCPNCRQAQLRAAAARTKGAHAAARTLYKTIYDKYVSVRSPGGQRFSSSAWLSVGGTKEEVNKILEQSGAVVVFLPPVDEGLDFPLRKQVSRVLGDESDLPKTRKITGGIKSVEHEHFNMQKGIQDRNPAALLEKDTIDSLFKSMGGEVKYDPTPGDFEQAVGKLALIRASDAAKELAVIFNRPPKLDAVALKALALFGVVWIHQTPSTMVIYNEQFAGPDTKEFVDIYNGVFRP